MCRLTAHKMCAFDVNSIVKRTIYMYVSSPQSLGIAVQLILRLLLTHISELVEPISPAPEPIRLNLVDLVCKFLKRLCPIRRHLRPPCDLSCFPQIYGKEIGEER